MKDIPVFFQGDDIRVHLTYGSECDDIHIDGYNDAEFTEEFTEEFGTLSTVTTIEAKTLINNIDQDTAPDIDFTATTITIGVDRADTIEFEKGLLEVELLFTIDTEGEETHVVKRIQLGWLKDAHTASL